MINGCNEMLAPNVTVEGLPAPCGASPGCFSEEAEGMAELMDEGPKAAMEPLACLFHTAFPGAGIQGKGFVVTASSAGLLKNERETLLENSQAN